MNDLGPLRLPASLRDKIWGRRDARPFFGEREHPLGEAWYTFEENRVVEGPFAGFTLGDLIERLGPRLMGEAHRPRALRRRSAGEDPASEPSGPYFPILTKLLFTSQKLSVQVHPDDEYGLSRAGGPGKTEMWYVVAAEPGASVALGLTEALSGDDLAAASISGEIERYLNWVPVQAGDAVFVPAGLLHTLGPGLTICEIQQNSDLTYRFFDFGRLGHDGKPRELHLEAAVETTRHGPPRGSLTPARLPAAGFERELLVACPHFAVERLRFAPGACVYRADRARFHILAFVSGRGWIGESSYEPGDFFLTPAGAAPFGIRAEQPSVAMLAYEPDLPALRREAGPAAAVFD